MEEAEAVALDHLIIIVSRPQRQQHAEGSRLGPMLGHDGRLKGDLTVLNWGDGTWWIMGSYYLRAWHMRWFNDHLDEGVSVRDVGEEVAGFSLSGPKSREVVERFHRDGQSVATIGSELGLPEGTVKSHLHRARRRLAARGGEEVNE